MPLRLRYRVECDQARKRNVRVFLFYLDEGEHTIELMATLGDFGDILSRVQEISRSLNDSYLQIMKLTGVQPDANRDLRLRTHHTRGYHEHQRESGRAPGNR